MCASLCVQYVLCTLSSFPICNNTYGCNTRHLIRKVMQHSSPFDVMMLSRHRPSHLPQVSLAFCFVTYTRVGYCAHELHLVSLTQRSLPDTLLDDAPLLYSYPPFHSPSSPLPSSATGIITPSWHSRYRNTTRYLVPIKTPAECKDRSHHEQMTSNVSSLLHTHSYVTHNT